ncbi:MAG: signal recognition particle protein [Alphaproteobacteria bacterium]|nr:signal recognition particle protein [Alphaproteobacteria bacterium]
MFEGLSSKLTGIFDRLTGRGALNEADVTEAMREVRVALLEADVALPVIKDFVARVKEAAVGQDVMRSITPGQQVVKIVHDHLVDLLGRTAEPLNVGVTPPAVIMMLGLQGSGKTTSSAKLAKYLTEQERKKVLLASLDVQRPAAQEQLAVLGQQINVVSLQIIAGQTPVQIAGRALDTARKEGFDVLILDTAGRLSIDEELMAEAASVRDATGPHERLLVVDAMTGQDAVETARRFDAQIGITGIVMTRIDGDARGGAALSMRAVTGKPIKFLGVGEKTAALEVYHPDRLANRILGMGDVVSLVEKAAAAIDANEARDMAEKFMSGKAFDFDDLAKHLQQMQKLGGLSGMMGMLPGIGKLKDKLKDANVDDKLLKRQEAIIRSMTPAERKDVDLLGAARKRRIAKGSGVEVSEVNKLIKQFLEMQRVMKQVKKMGKGGLLGGLMPKLKGGEMPDLSHLMGGKEF